MRKTGGALKGSPREKQPRGQNRQGDQAAKITSRLYLRIRRSYACVQPISRSAAEAFPDTPNNPLAFTIHF
jgi:hypothetical protein